MWGGETWGPLFPLVAFSYVIFVCVGTEENPVQSS